MKTQKSLLDNLPDKRKEFIQKLDPEGLKKIFHNREVALEYAKDASVLKRVVFGLTETFFNSSFIISSIRLGEVFLSIFLSAKVKIFITSPDSLSFAFISILPKDLISLRGSLINEL